MSHIFESGDCLELIKKLDTNSIDFCYFNPPFGITQCEYDKPLNWSELWPEIWRVLKPKGTVAIHSSQPFTFDLVASQRKHFKYNWYWKKLGARPTNFLGCRYQPMRIMEEICIFYKKHGTYNRQMTLKEKPVILKQKLNNDSSTYYRVDSYKNKIREHKILTHNNPIHLLEMKRRNHKFSTRTVEMCEYFIKTYSNKGDTVLDLTRSDGQTALACHNLERFYIGFDLDPNMIQLSQNRYENHIL